jgi:hypothetical protein
MTFALGAARVGHLAQGVFETVTLGGVQGAAGGDPDGEGGAGWARAKLSALAVYSEPGNHDTQPARTTFNSVEQTPKTRAADPQTQNLASVLAAAVNGTDQWRELPVLSHPWASAQGADAYVVRSRLASDLMPVISETLA